MRRREIMSFQVIEFRKPASRLLGIIGYAPPDPWKCPMCRTDLRETRALVLNSNLDRLIWLFQGI